MLKTIKFIQAASAITFVLFSASTLAQNAREVAKKVFPSVALIVMEDENGQPLSLGSGFFVGERKLVTNFHVVEGGARGYVKNHGSKQKFNIEGLAAVDRFHDLALVVIDGGTATPLVIGDSEKVVIGDEIYAVGNPQGLEGTFSQGIVSSLRTIGTNTILQITAPISPGSSGGPVLNQAGEVVGVAVATYKGGQNLNFAIPSSRVQDLVKSSGAVEPLATTTKRKSSSSVLEDMGGRSVEGVVGAQFAWSSEFESIYNDEFTFSLRNLLREPVKNVYCIVVFYDRSEKPIQFVPVLWSEQIPAGLATRVKREVDGSVKKLTTSYTIPLAARIYAPTPATKLEIRVLNFELAD